MNIERQLASVQKIEEIVPIFKDGVEADNIVMTKVLGWECVTQKSNGFLPGDLVIYFEIDSILPEHPEFEFMRPRKFRVKTAKFLGQISQGLILPLDKVKEFKPSIKLAKLKEGDDLTDIIGVKKHDPVADAENRAVFKNKKKHNKIVKFMMKFKWFRLLYKKMNPPTIINFPDFISKTDEPRIQNIRNIHEYHGMKLYATEKLDGQSSTFGFKDKIFYCCSRRLCYLKPADNNWWTISKKYDLTNKLKNLPYFIQGEIVGPGIQSNRYKLNELELYVFNIYDIQQRKFIPLHTRLSICDSLGIKHVPVILEEFEFSNEITIKNFVDLSHGKSKLNKNVLREGIVFRTYNESTSFKVIDPKYLLKTE